MKNQNRSYLAHEYFNRDWTPFYFADVARDLADAKLDFLGSGALLEGLTSVNLSPDQQNILADISDVIYRETVKDYIINQQFRRDIFVKGPLSIGGTAGRQIWLDSRFVLATLRADIPATIPVPQGNATLQPTIYQPLLDALGNEVRTVRELVAHEAIAKLGWSQLQQALLVLVGAGHLQPCLPAKGENGRAKVTKGFNSAVCERARDSGDIQYLASPVTGGGVHVDRFQQLFLLAIRDGAKAPPAWASFAWQILGPVGTRLLKDGKVIETDAGNLAELNARATDFVTKRLPVLKSMQIL